MRGLAVALFDGLAAQTAGAHNPVFALLPDVISHLTATPDLPEAHFRDVMARLLRYVTLDRQREALVARVAGRITGETSVKAARGFAYCLAQLRVSVRGLAALEERLPQLKHFLADGEFDATLRVRRRPLPPLAAWRPKRSESMACNCVGALPGNGGNARARVCLQDIVKRLEDANKERPEACEAIKAFVTRLDAARAEVAELCGDADAAVDVGGGGKASASESGSATRGSVKPGKTKGRARRGAAAAARCDSSGDEASDAESSPRVAPPARGRRRATASQSQQPEDVAGPSRHIDRRSRAAAGGGHSESDGADSDDDFARSAPATPVRRSGQRGGSARDGADSAVAASPGSESD